MVGYIWLLIFLTVLPYLLGTLLTDREELGVYTLPARWCLGWIILMAAFYIPGVICNMVHTSLTFLTVAYHVVLVFLLTFSIKKILKERRRFGNEFREFFREITFPEIAAMVCVTAHAAVTFLYMHVDDDDYTFVANATTSLDTNTLMLYNGGRGLALNGHYTQDTLQRLMVSPEYAFYAVLSKSSGIRPAPLAHTFLPPVFTFLFFIAFLLVGAELFQRDRSKTGLFVLFTYVASVFSYVSTHTAGTVLLIRSWQGKAQVAGLILPLVLWCYIRIFKKKRMERKDAVLLAAVLEAGCLMTAMGAALSDIMAAGLVLIVFWMTKERNVITRSIAPMLFPVFTAALYYGIGAGWLS